MGRGGETPILLSIEEAAARTPWSASTLYREAPKPGSPFTKQAGRWVTTPQKLEEWAERGEKPRRRDHSSADPMPPRRNGGSFRAQVYELDARRKAA